MGLYLNAVDFTRRLAGLFLQKINFTELIKIPQKISGNYPRTGAVILREHIAAIWPVSSQWCCLRLPRVWIQFLCV